MLSNNFGLSTAGEVHTTWAAGMTNLAIHY